MTTLNNKLSKRQAQRLISKAKDAFEEIAAIFNDGKKEEYVVREEVREQCSMYRIAMVSMHVCPIITRAVLNRLIEYANKASRKHDEQIWFSLETREQYDVERDEWKTSPAFVFSINYEE